MSKRYPRAKWVLPLVVDPPERICFTIDVPNDIQHLAAFRGAILNLCSAMQWQDDIAHTAKDVAQVWFDVYSKIRRCAETSDDSGITLEDFMSQQIRLKPGDPCIIQMWCIDDWQDWYDPRSCIPGTIEQPTDGDDIEPGQCREWDVSLRANEKWLLPAVVSENDVIEVTAASGAWNDGGIGWNCVNGQTFALGACVSDDPGEISDPLPAVNHMRLVQSIDGTFYDAYNTLTVVPGGVSDGQVFFQANDDPIDDNSGAVSFHVKLCRFEPTPSTITLSYTVGTGPVTLDPSLSEWIISMTATVEDGYAIRMTLSEDVKLTIQSAPGYSVNCPSSDCAIAGFFEGGSSVETIHWPAHSTPVDLTPNTTCDGFQVATGIAGTPASFTVQMKIVRL